MDCFVKGVTDDGQGRGVEVIEVLFRIKLPRRPPWL